MLKKIPFFDKIIVYVKIGKIANMKKLLICTDGSFPYTESCLKYAEWLIKKTGANADVLYVSETHSFDFSMMADFTGSIGAQPYQGLYGQIKQIEQEKASKNFMFLPIYIFKNKIPLLKTFLMPRCPCTGHDQGYPSCRRTGSGCHWPASRTVLECSR